MAYNPLAFGQMLVAMGALVFAAYLHKQYKGSLDSKQEKGFGGVFILLGVIASMFGYGLFLNEPIPGHYIEIYGVGYLVFTMLMLIGGLSMIFGWDKRPASYLAVVGGIALLNSAYTVAKFSLSKSPMGTTAIFALAGLGSVASVLLTHGDLKRKRNLLIAAIVIFVLFGLMALYSGMGAQTGHVARAVLETA